MATRKCSFWLVLTAMMLSAVSARAGLVLDDPLQGSSGGTRSGGSYVMGGWQVTGQHDCIYWHLPHTVSKGAAEFDVRGLYPNECRAGMEDKSELFHMYDYTWYNSDVQYGDPGYRNNPYKHFIRKTGCLGSYNGSIDSLEVVWSCNGDWYEADSPVLSWNQSNTYHFRVEWGPDGSGNSVLTIFRDGNQVLRRGAAGSYAPAGHSVRIAASNRLASDAGAPIGAVFSNVKVWDLSDYLPNAPTVVSPANGETIKSSVAFIKWTGDSHTKYQVRVSTADDPNSGVSWDSGEVASDRDYAWTGTLGDLTTYYVFVRLATPAGWSNWSAAGRWFRIDSSYSPADQIVKLQGKTLCDKNGPFLGLGVTYMAGVWMCKNDRTNYRSDLGFLRDKGFNYIRILSEVPGACPNDYWHDRGIHPVNFTCPHGVTGYAWPDYDQQLKDAIDIAYDEYGIMTEVTIFGGAGEAMPAKSTRQAHLNRVLSDIAGREHKIVQIEVANEAWQTGFPGTQGQADLREFGQYLAERTAIPISLTSPQDTSVAGIQGQYAGSSADICTVHYTRDLGTSEGHWLPVRDCWESGDVAGLMPCSSNEPVGPGSSVSTEEHPIHLASAAAFAWTANLPMYVFHSSAGVRRDPTFQSMAGINDMVYLRQILPPDLSSWIRNDGKESSAPLTAFCNGTPDKYWTDVSNASTGCHRNIGAIKGNEFVCYPQGILSGGLELQARRSVALKVYNPLTGVLVYDLVKNAGDRFTLVQGPAACIIRGQFTDTPSPRTLNAKLAETITIDGNSGDWDLSQFTTTIRGGQSGSGDIALVGYDGGNLYYSGYYNGSALPTNAADHTARVYSRHDTVYQYYLVRCDDNDIRYPDPVDSNWQNDCVEFYIDPSNNGGGEALSSSMSDAQLVIDANNQRNVYCCPEPYRTQVLNGVNSAVVRDASGWWLEVRIAKAALDPDMPLAGTIGADFNFRDNDNNNDPALSTVYCWGDNTVSGGFPSKIPDKWGDVVLGGSGDSINSVSSTKANGTYKNPEIINIQLAFNENAYVTGTPQLALNTAASRKAGYSSGSGTNTLVFTYIVQIGDNAADLDCTGSEALTLNGGTIKNVSGVSLDLRLPPPGMPGSLGNNKDICVDAVRPKVASISSDKSDGAYKAGEVIDLVVTFSEVVNVVGTPQLELETGSVDRKADYVSGSGTYALLFRYAVQSGDASADLDYKAASSLLANGGSIKDPIGNYAVMTLPAPAAAGSLGYNKSIAIDNTAPSSSASPAGGVYGSAQSVTLNANEAATIYYTTDGSIPTAASSAYSSPISIASDASLKFYAVDSAGNAEMGMKQENYAILTSAGATRDARGLAPGQPVRLGDKVLYLKQGSFGYICEPNRVAGIRIEGTIPAEVGRLINLTGTRKQTAGGEPFVELIALTPGDLALVDPLGTNIRASRLSPIEGLYVNVWGLVSSVGPNSFVINDGSDNTGITVITQGAPGVTDGAFATVRGAAGYSTARVIYANEVRTY